MRGLKYGSNFVSFRMATQLSQHHLLKSPLPQCFELPPSLYTKLP